MSTNIPEREWKTALTSILEELDESEYKKMLKCSYLDKIPTGVKTSTSKEEMPQKIIKYFGVDESIYAVHRTMALIPRKDRAVQDLLHPFVDKLRKKREEENKGKKRKHESESESSDEEPKPKTRKKRKHERHSKSADKERKHKSRKKRKHKRRSKSTGKERKRKSRKKRKHERHSKSADKERKRKSRFKRNNIVSDSDSSDEEQKVAADQLNSTQPDKERKIPSWRKTIKDVLTSGDLGNKVITGKVVQKSALRTYQTKEGEKKFFFYLGVSDETSCIKVMVYGADRYQHFQEGRCYSIRNVIMEEDVMKVTKQSKVAETGPVDVPEELEMEAGMLIYHQKPVCSIAEAKQYADKTAVSVEGTVTEIGHVEPTKVKNQRRKKEKQDFHLNDGKDSIRISLWGKDTKQLRGISDGDFVRVTNVKTNHYYETVSLNSTDFTKIYKIKSAAIQNVTIEIIGIMKAGMMETEIKAGIDDQFKTFVVASKLLAKVFNVRLEGDLKNRLVQKIPLSANVEIQGHKIITITAVNEM